VNKHMRIYFLVLALLPFVTVFFYILINQGQEFDEFSEGFRNVIRFSSTLYFFIFLFFTFLLVFKTRIDPTEKILILIGFLIVGPIAFIYYTFFVYQKGELDS